MEYVSRNRLVAFFLALGLSSLGLAAYSAAELGLFADSRFHGTTYDDSTPAPAFSLPDHHGGLTTLADLSGRAVLLFFGYTECPDVCPLTLSRLTQVLEDASLGPEQVAIVLVSVDPLNDTPQRLAQYVTKFGPHTIGLTGDPAQLQNLFAQYGVYASPATSHDGQPTLAHTSQIFGIDPAGRLRVLIHGDSPADLIESDIYALLHTR